MAYIAWYQVIVSTEGTREPPWVEPLSQSGSHAAVVDYIRSNWLEGNVSCALTIATACVQLDEGAKVRVTRETDPVTWDFWIEETV